MGIWTDREDPVMVSEKIKETCLYLLRRFFILAENHISLNVSKVLAVANAAGFIFSILLVDSDCYIQVLACMTMFGVLAAFFGVLTVIIEEEIDLEHLEEDELY